MSLKIRYEGLCEPTWMYWPNMTLLAKYSNSTITSQCSIWYGKMVRRAPSLFSISGSPSPSSRNVEVGIEHCHAAEQMHLGYTRCPYNMRSVQCACRFLRQCAHEKTNVRHIRPSMHCTQGLGYNNLRTVSQDTCEIQKQGQQKKFHLQITSPAISYLPTAPLTPTIDQPLDSVGSLIGGSHQNVPTT